MTQPTAPGNPLLADWTTPDKVPPFDAIKPEHFRAAYAQALADHDAEIAAITANPAPPSFDNTIAALELSGKRWRRSTTCSTSWPAPTATTRCLKSSARCRR